MMMVSFLRKMVGRLLFCRVVLLLQMLYNLKIYSLS